MLYDLICGLHGLFRALRAEKWLHKWPFKGEMTGFINIISWYGQWNLMLIKQFKVAEMVFNTLSESWEGWFVVCEGWFWAWEDWYLSTESWFEIYKAWFEVRGALKGTKSCKTQEFGLKQGWFKARGTLIWAWERWVKAWKSWFMDWKKADFRLEGPCFRLKGTNLRAKTI